MKISVIVPAYTPDENTKALFNRCVKSLDDRFDVIIIEDEDHLGVATARNKGLEIALAGKPDYVTFLDADDEYAPDAYDQIVEAIKESEGAPLIQLNHVRIFPDGSMKPRLWNKAGDYELDELPKLWVSVCNKVFEADLIENVRFDPYLSHGEDEIFILECLIQTRRIYNSKRIALYYHKDNPNSLSTKTDFDELMSEQRALIDFLECNSDDREICEAIRKRQVELWDNECYKRVIRGDT